MSVSDRVEPGDYVYMVVGDSQYLMNAILEKGKTYYVEIVPRWGFVMTRFIFRPQDVKNNDISKDYYECTLYEPKAEAYEWFDKKRNSFDKRYDNAEFTSYLSVEYGTDKPYDFMREKKKKKDSTTKY